MKIQLSISLLASSRIASLKRCLDSLRPLLMQIPSELIVVFTGTDERVYEIAAQYTDQIVAFPWCNDFSAARNAGLKLAKGEWFLYIDDDEWFEDITEIRDFFMSGEYRNWGMACYKQKNYLDWSGTQCLDFYAMRLLRIVPETRFQNPIHEEPVPRFAPCKYLDAFVHHYGYMLSDKKSQEIKSGRNLPLLLQDIQKRPAYIKNYIQITYEYESKKEMDKAEQYCRRGYELCKRPEDTPYLHWLQAELVRILYHKKDYRKAEAEALGILKKKSPCDIVRLELYTVLTLINKKENKPENTLQYGILFEDTFTFMEENPQLWREQGYADLEEARFRQTKRLNQIRMGCIEAAMQIKKTDKACRFLKLLPWDNETEIQKLYPAFDDFKKQYGIHFQKLLQVFPNDSPYLLLQDAIQSYNEGDADSGRELLLKCIERTDSSHLHLQAIKEAVLYQTDLEPFTDIITLDIWEDYMPGISEMVPAEEIPKIKETSKRLIETAPLYGLLLERAVCRQELVKGYPMGSQLTSLLLEYAQCILSFYKKIYKEELFEEKGQKFLPNECRFAIHILEALERIDHADYVGAIRFFRKAIKFSPIMSGVVNEIARELRSSAENPVMGAESEFQALAVQMKEALKAMLEKGQLNEAMSVALQLSSLLPMDLELLRLKQKILREISP